MILSSGIGSRNLALGFFRQIFPNSQGYCDVFHKCRQVDAEGPLVRLTNLIFNERALTSAREWLTSNWWAVLLVGIGLVVVTGTQNELILARHCSTHHVRD